MRLIVMFGRWREAVKARQPSNQGQVFDHKLYFGRDGEPIVVWEDFFPM